MKKFNLSCKILRINFKQFLCLNGLLFLFLFVVFIQARSFTDAFFQHSEWPFLRYKMRTLKDIQFNARMIFAETHLGYRNNLKYFWSDVFSKKSVESKNISSIDIRLNDKDLQTLNSNLPLSGYESIETILKVNNQKSTFVKLNYGHIGASHISFHNKTMRIRANDPHYPLKHLGFDLVSVQHGFPAMDIVSRSLLSVTQLPMPEMELILKKVNGRLNGLSILTADFDEEFFTENNIGNGVVLRYDNLKKYGAPFEGSGMWRRPDDWSLGYDFGGHSKDFVTSAAQKILESRNIEDFAKYWDVSSLLDLMAYDVIVGSRARWSSTDFRVLANSIQGKLKLLPWDNTVWDHRPIFLYSRNPIYDFVRLNESLEFELQKRVWQMLNSNLKIQVRKDIFMEWYRKLQAVYSDIPHVVSYPMGGQFLTPYYSAVNLDDLERVKNDMLLMIDCREDFLKTYLGDARAEIHLQAKGETLYVRNSGNVPLKVVVHTTDYFVYPRTEENRGSTYADPNYLDLYGRGYFKKTAQFNKISLSAPIRDSDVRIYNAVTGNEIPMQKLAQEPNVLSQIEIAPAYLHSNEAASAEKKTKIIGPGIVQIHNSNNVFEMPVIIRPGTVFVMDEQTPVIFKGGVIAEGTSSNKIHFKFNKAFPSFVGIFNSKNTNILTFCEISNGGSGLYELIEAGGALSIVGSAAHLSNLTLISESDQTQIHLAQAKVIGKNVRALKGLGVRPLVLMISSQAEMSNAHLDSASSDTNIKLVHSKFSLMDSELKNFFITGIDMSVGSELNARGGAIANGKYAVTSSGRNTVRLDHVKIRQVQFNLWINEFGVEHFSNVTLIGVLPILSGKVLSRVEVLNDK